MKFTFFFIFCVFWLPSVFSSKPCHSFQWLSEWACLNGTLSEISLSTHQLRAHFIVPPRATEQRALWYRPSFSLHLPKNLCSVLPVQLFYSLGEFWFSWLNTFLAVLVYSVVWRNRQESTMPAVFKDVQTNTHLFTFSQLRTRTLEISGCTFWTRVVSFRWPKSTYMFAHITVKPPPPPLPYYCRREVWAVF